MFLKLILKQNAMQTYTDQDDRKKGEISYQNTRFENTSLDFLSKKLNKRNKFNLLLLF